MPSVSEHGSFDVASSFEVEVPSMLLADTVNEDPIVRSLLLPFMFMFQGYGVMVGNPQHSLKSRLGIKALTPEAKDWTSATSLFQWGKCITRLAQVVFLVFLQPHGLVYLAFVVMLVAVLIPPIFIYGAGMTSITLVCVAYFLGGVAVGIFEGTFLSVISALGHRTKLWTIMGSALGFGMLNIVLGTALAAGLMPVEFYYYYTAACIPIGAAVYARRAPKAHVNNSGKGCLVFRNSMRKQKEWLPQMVPWLIAKFVANFVLENNFPLAFNVYNTGSVPFFGGPASTTGLVPTQYYLSLYYFVMLMLGDTISRRLPSRIPLRDWNGCLFWLGFGIFLCFAGEGLLFFLVPLVTGVGTFLALFGQGFIYGLSAKYIDSFVAKEHSYAAYMTWCFAGDIGGIVGASTVVNAMVGMLCEGRHHTYVCKLPDVAPVVFE